MDNSEFQGVDFIDETTPEVLFMEQIDNEHIKETLEKLSETQRRRLLMLACGMSIHDIAKSEGTDYRAVYDSIKQARKKFQKIF